DFEFTAQRAPDAGPHRGRKAAQARIEDAVAAYGAASYDVESLRESGEQVVALLRISAQPKGSTATMENRVGHVWTIGDRKVLSLHTFPKPRQALEAAGLSEETMSRENVEIVEAVVAALNRGDWDEMLSYAAPDAKYDTSRDLNEWRGIYETPESVKRA